MARPTDDEPTEPTEPTEPAPADPTPEPEQSWRERMGEAGQIVSDEPPAE